MSYSQGLSSWSKAQTLKLLEELQKHPVLYDQSHPLYHMRDVRLASFRKIVANLKHLKSNMTPQLISRKIKVLKCQYWKEKKMLRESQLNIGTGEPPYKPKLWCFNMLTFFDKSTCSTYDQDTHPTDLSDESDTGGVSDVIEECYVDEKPYPMSSFEEVEVNGPFDEEKGVETTVVNDSRSELHEKCMKLVECLSEEMKVIKNENDSTTHNQKGLATFLGQMVETELAKVTEEIYDEAKWKIIHILEEASRKNRDAKLRAAQINISSTSATASSKKREYNLNGETRVTELGSAIFKRPLQNAVHSKRKSADTYRTKKLSARPNY